MAKNVATDIAEQLCESVATSLQGKNLPALSTVKSVVKKVCDFSLLFFSPLNCAHLCVCVFLQ
jgi:hypothetical protein